MAQWAQDLVTQTKSLASSAITSKVVKEPAGQAVLLVYDTTKVVKGHTVRVWQYDFDGASQSYLVTFVATPGSASYYGKVFAAAAASFTTG